MLRETNVQTLTWADKTMSVMRTRELEACEERLSSLPAFGLFSGCDDTNAEELWRISYDAQEHPLCRKLHTARDLTAMVMAQLPAEAALLSPKEHELMERLLAMGGTAELLDWSESTAAESLVRRLWCTLRYEDDDRLFIVLPQELITPLTLIVSSKAHQEIVAHLFDLHRTVFGLLYREGALHYAPALSHLQTDVLVGTYAENTQLAMRFLRTAFDYTFDDHGDMILLHPGLTDPEQLLPCLSIRKDIDFELESSDMLLADLFDEGEWIAANQLLGQISDSVRPDYQPQMAAEDLFMLAKQGVSLEEMADVLSSLLDVQPTRSMLDSLRLLKGQVACWGRIPTGMVQ